MKIYEIISEALVGPGSKMAQYTHPDIENQPQVAPLEGDVSDPTVKAVIDAVRELIGQGHTDVEPAVITNMVVAATGKPFLLKDLVAINNQSQEIQHYIDSINPSKVKFSNDILTVKNEDPNKQSQDKGAATVAKMAQRAGATRG